MKNAKFGCYLVCKEHINEVEKFLKQFFKEEKDNYQSGQWVTFQPKNSDFKINLMKGEDQELTQNMTFEIYFNSIDELRNFAKKHKCKIESFKVTNTKQKYIYNYIEILGPNNICKIEANYCEDVN